MRRFILLALLLVGASLCSMTEPGEALGHGYRVAMISEPSASSFESMRHTRYLMKGDSKIADVGEYAVSPDDRCIAYQEGSTAKVFLLDKVTGQIRELTPSASGLVRAYDWTRETGCLWLEMQDKKSVRLKIPEFKK